MSDRSARLSLIHIYKEVFDYANSIIPSITKVGDTNEANKWTNLDLPLADILKKMAKQLSLIHIYWRPRLPRPTPPNRSPSPPSLQRSATASCAISLDANASG